MPLTRISISQLLIYKVSSIIIIIINYSHKMEPVNVNVKDFAAKFRSKREVYTFLTIDGNA